MSCKASGRCQRAENIHKLEPEERAAWGRAPSPGPRQGESRPPSTSREASSGRGLPACVLKGIAVAASRPLPRHACRSHGYTDVLPPLKTVIKGPPPSGPASPASSPRGHVPLRQDSSRGAAVPEATLLPVLVIWNCATETALSTATPSDPRRGQLQVIKPHGHSPGTVLLRSALGTFRKCCLHVASGKPRSWFSCHMVHSSSACLPRLVSRTQNGAFHEDTVPRCLPSSPTLTCGAPPPFSWSSLLPARSVGQTRTVPP